MNNKESVSVKVLWKQAPKTGEVKVSNGVLSELAICAGEGKCETTHFSLSSEKGGIALSVNDVMIAHGACPTIVHVDCGEPSFSFILRDALFPDHPIYISEYGVVISSADDQRSYDEIVEAATSGGKESDFQRFEREEEESWETAAARNRKQYCPTWLGVARDMRIFRVAQQENYGYWGEIIPAYHSKPCDINFENGAVGSIKFEIGQGDSCKVDVSRRLEDGYLPILRSIQKEGAMEYHLTLFATLENSPLRSDRVCGSDFEAAYAFMGGNMLSEEERGAISELIDAETKGREEEVVCRCRVEVVNTGKTPCYAWIKTPHFFPGGAFGYEDAFDSATGFLKLKNGDARVATLVDGKPATDEEMAILTQPAKSVIVDFIIPHSPVSVERMKGMSLQSFSEHLAATKSYWEEKLDRAARIAVPETHIDEMVKAGLLHCDIVTIGKEPDDALAATIGWYSPIGTESAPIIQFYDSMGWHNEAERSIDFFLERQRDDGFIQNFARYESETGPLLWTMGEHFRYTRDTDWLKRVMPNIDKAVEYLLAWRERNKTDKHRAEGCYGLVDGKVADPEDYFHQFFLNAGTYAGLKRCVEMYEVVDAAKAAKLADEAAEYRCDLRVAFKRAMAEAPVVPTGDGSWAPFAPPWTDKLDSTALYIRKGNWFTHGAFTARESLVGPLWLIFHEVFDADELESSFMLKTNQSPVTVENACLSQPYYCRHDFAHISRGEVKPFLKTYYNQLTGLIDQETYTFWEHYHHASQHKTHEEGWFLMQTRWMLYLEDADALKLFPAIPRKWLSPGESVELDDVASYFGKIKATAKCSDDGNEISCEVAMDSERKPDKLIVRLPHFNGQKPQEVSGGVYDPENETIIVKDFTGKTTIKMLF